jgi:hypothetical protein
MQISILLQKSQYVVTSLVAMDIQSAAKNCKKLLLEFIGETETWLFDRLTILTRPVFHGASMDSLKYR